MGSSYLVEVKPSVFIETSLTPTDFDPVSNLSLSEDQFEERLLMEFISREDAESWISSLRPKLSHRAGQLTIHEAHYQDDSEVDGYLIFHPRT
jgi:hypothetical protein